jgi:hypothetical protein
MADFTQLDLYRDADRESRARVFLQAAADRYGIAELAAKHKLDETTLRNQLSYRKRQDKTNSFWRPSADVVWTLFFADRKLRQELLELCDEELADVEKIEPEDALRDVQAMAIAGEFGNAGREKVVSLIRRVKRGRR